MADAVDHSSLPWRDLFVSYADTGFYGYVKDIDSANDLVLDFSYHTATSYVVTRATKDFGNFSLDQPSKEHSIRFKDDCRVQRGSCVNLEGVPFMMVGTRVMECHQGPTHKKEKSDVTVTESEEHNYLEDAQKTKRTTRGSKKIGCPAVVFMREVIAFPEYKMAADSSLYFKKLASEKLRNDLHSVNYTDIQINKYIFIDLPKPEQHEGHIMVDAANLKAPIDQRVIDHVNKMVDAGVYDATEMKQHIEAFVGTVFGTTMPTPINRRFFPNQADIRKMIYRRKRKQQVISKSEPASWLLQVSPHKRHKTADLSIPRREVRESLAHVSSLISHCKSADILKKVKDRLDGVSKLIKENSSDLSKEDDTSITLTNDAVTPGPTEQQVYIVIKQSSPTKEVEIISQLETDHMQLVS